MKECEGAEKIREKEWPERKKVRKGSRQIVEEKLNTDTGHSEIS